MQKQTLELKQTQHLSPVQIQAIKLLELPVQDLEQRIRKELEENPVLDDTPSGNNQDEESKDISLDEIKDDDYIPAYRLKVKNWGPDPRPEYDTFSVKESFSQSLEDQLGCKDLTEKEMRIALFIVGSLDDDGYLRRDLESIVDDLAFREGLIADSDEVNAMLDVIKTLDPPGIGARNLQECLSLQLKVARQTPETIIARRIIDEQFQEFANRHFDKLQKSLGIDEDDLKSAMKRILKLNPAPGGQSGNAYDDSAQQVVPDFVLEEKGGELSFSMPRFNVPELRVNKRYAAILEDAAKGSSDADKKEAAAFVKQKFDRAKWFVEALKQRQNTLKKTMQAILDFQYGFFLNGEETSLKPMVLKDIAEVTGFDISTISRVVGSKFIDTRFGIFPLKYFFSEGMENAEGEEISTRELKKALQDCVDGENKKKPLTDEQLVEEMSKKGYKLARRTIAKYRSQLGIPLARWRKEI